MIYINNDKDIEGMRLAGRIAAETLDYMKYCVQVGVTTNELNKLAHDFITSKGAVPAPLNYNCYPKSICTSVNDVATHGVPSDYVLKNGDSLNIDVTVIKNGYHGDSSRMYHVYFPLNGGPMLGSDAEILDQYARYCFMKGICAVKAGAKFSAIGDAITSAGNALHRRNVYYKKPKLIRSVFGHGIGKTFHAEPTIPHYMTFNDDVMQEGMCFTIEPCFSAGAEATFVDVDGWSNRTRDGSITAQWEHTILVTKDGCEILTLGKDEVV